MKWAIRFRWLDETDKKWHQKTTRWYDNSNDAWDEKDDFERKLNRKVVFYESASSLIHKGK